MSRAFFVIVLLFGLMTLLLGAYDFFGPAARDGFLHTGGEVWFAASVDTLNLMQAVTQRYLSPSLWDPGIVSLLKLPAVALTGGLSAFFAALWLLSRR